MSFDYTFGKRDGCTLQKILRMPRKVCCMLFLHVLLSTTLSLFDSEVGTGAILYHFSGELVSATNGYLLKSRTQLCFRTWVLGPSEF